MKIPGAYNAADYNNLNVSSEVKELFKYITRWVVGREINLGGVVLNLQ